MAPLAALRPEARALWQIAPFLLYLGLDASVFAFFAWQQGVRGLGPRRAGVFLHLAPVFGVALGAVRLGEPVTQAKAADLSASCAVRPWRRRALLRAGPGLRGSGRFDPRSGEPKSFGLTGQGHDGGCRRLRGRPLAYSAARA